MKGIRAMKTNRSYRFAAILAVCSALHLGAQTAAEELQKGIFTQETAGDLDGAIGIYRQIVDTGSTPREIAAQAQYRLGEALLEKGDLAGAAAEFDKLSRSYPDYGSMIGNLATMARAGRGARSGAQPAQDQIQQLLTQIAALEMRRRDAETRGDSAQLQQLQRFDELRAVEERLKALASAGAAQSQQSSAPAPPGTIRVGANVQAANIISQAKVSYPPLAKAARVQGTVRFEATIGKDGHVENLQLVSGPPLLVQAAMDSVRQWIYKPTLLNGQPVSVVTTVDVNFTLSE
jgi:TonB family protein